MLVKGATGERHRKPTVFFKTRGHHSCLVWLTQRDAQPCLASSCLWLSATLVVIGLQNVLWECHICASCEMDIDIYWWIMIRWKLPGNAKPGKTRQDQAAPREDGVPWFWKRLYFDKSTLVHVMARCREAPRHYLSQCWPWSMWPYGVSRPQCVYICHPGRIRLFSKSKAFKAFQENIK